MSNNRDSHPTPGGLVTAEKLSQLLGLSVNRVKTLRAEGAFVTAESQNEGRKFILGASLISYIKYLQARQDNASVRRQYLEAKARRALARAKMEEDRLSSDT
jgi:phage terminase Nu1 subunit (DNA packaging protein)